MAFKIPKKTFFVKIEVCEEIVRFSHIGEYTKEHLIVSAWPLINSTRTGWSHSVSMN